MFQEIKHIVILTGAGVSAESGIKTFRDQGGLWESYRIEDVATPEAFALNQKLVYEFYRTRYKDLKSPQVRPNKAHLALAELEKNFKGRVTLITQNVDDLHERAGSMDPIHMHGELNKMRCVKTQQVFPMIQDLSEESICSCCHVKKQLRPHIVWFGEIPFFMDEIEDELSTCDLFISIGTSGLVYPAAMFVQMAKEMNQAYSIEINLDPTQNSREFDRHLFGQASLVVPELVQEILSRSS